MRVIIFALVIAAVVVANIDTVSSAPVEATTAPSAAAVEPITKDPRLAENRDERAPICKPGDKYLIWGVKCVCAADAKGLDCEGVTGMP